MILRLHCLGLFFLFCSISSLHSQRNYYLVYDNIKSPVMGAELLTAGNFMFSTVENKYLGPRIFSEKNRLGKGANIGYRLTKTFIIDRVFADFLRVFQHEIFGHGARAREYGWDKSRYRISFPSGGGSTFYGAGPTNRILSSAESTMRTIGGPEATMLMANTIRNQWLQSREIYASETYLYATSFLSFSFAMRRFKDDSVTNSSDISIYHYQLNRHYGDASTEAIFTPAFLRKRSLLNFANPAVYYSLWVLIKDYIGQGKSTVRLPMIRLGKMHYLPMFRLGLSPFGTELYLENFLRTEGSVYGLTLRLGDNIFGRQWGVQAKSDRLLSNDWLQLDASADLWRQPEFYLGGESTTLQEAGMGAAVRATLHLKFPKSDGAGFIQVLYKTPGYLEGQILRGGAFVRWGASLFIANRMN